MDFVRLRMSTDSSRTKHFCNFIFTGIISFLQQLCLNRCLFSILQHHSDTTSSTPFLSLNANKEIVLYPILSVPKDTSIPEDVAMETEIPTARTKIDVPLNKWIHIGCEVYFKHIFLRILIKF